MFHQMFHSFKQIFPVLNEICAFMIPRESSSSSSLLTAELLYPLEYSRIKVKTKNNSVF